MTIRSMRPGTVIEVRFAFWSSPRNKAATDASPVEWPDSKRLIGRILSVPIRPAPECNSRSYLGVAEPVRMYRPRRRRSSTCRRTWSHISGARCHSSKRIGISWSNSSSGLSPRSARAFGSVSKRTELFACWRAVSVFPQPFGPSMRTAPIEVSRSDSSASTMRARYSNIASVYVSDSLNSLFSTITPRRFRQVRFACSGSPQAIPRYPAEFPAASRTMFPYPNVRTPESPVVVKNRPANKTVTSQSNRATLSCGVDTDAVRAGRPQRFET